MPGSVPSLLHNLAHIALRQSDRDQTRRLFAESAIMFRNQGDQRGLADCLEGLAGVFAELDDPERGARLIGAAQELRERTGSRVWPANAADIARIRESLRAHLGVSRLEQALAEGRVLPLNQVIANAVEEPRVATGEQAAGVERPRLTTAEIASSRLSSLEMEVPSLVVEGLTNSEIGSRLIIGGRHSHPKSVVYQLTETHVRMSGPDGSSREVDLKPGQITWGPGGVHAVENVGPNHDWGIIVELKR